MSSSHEPNTNSIAIRLQQKPVVLLLSAFSCLLWGSAFPALKISYEMLSLHPGDWGAKVLFAGYRFFLASLLLFFVTSMVFKKPLRVTGRLLRWSILLGVLQTALQYFFFYNGLAFSTGIKSSIIVSTGSLFVVLFSRIYYRNDYLTFEKVLGLLLGFGGVILVNVSKGALNFTFTMAGEGFLLFSSLVSALGTILAKELSGRVHPFLVTAYQMLFGSLLLIITGLIASDIGAVVFDWKSGLMLLYLAFASAAAFSIWYTILKYNKPGEVTVYRFLVPVWGTLLSAWFLPGEVLGLGTLAALLLVSLGIALVNRRRPQPSTTSP